MVSDETAHAASPPSRAGVLPLVANALAFNFTNTASGRGGPRALEHLCNPEHVIAWAAHAGILPSRDSSALRRLAQGSSGNDSSCFLPALLHSFHFRCTP